MVESDAKTRTELAGILADIPLFPFFHFYINGQKIKEVANPSQEYLQELAKIYSHSEMYLVNVSRNLYNTKYKYLENDGEIFESDEYIPLIPGKIVHVKNELQYQTIMSLKGKLMVINISTEDGPCKNIIPTFERLAEKHINAIFVYIDYLKCKHKIRAISDVNRYPMFRFYRNGERIRQFSGDSPGYLETIVIQLDID